MSPEPKYSYLKVQQILLFNKNKNNMLCYNFYSYELAVASTIQNNICVGEHFKNIIAPKLNEQIPQSNGASRSIVGKFAGVVW